MSAEDYDEAVSSYSADSEDSSSGSECMADVAEGAVWGATLGAASALVTGGNIPVAAALGAATGAAQALATSPNCAID